MANVTPPSGLLPPAPSPDIASLQAQHDHTTAVYQKTSGATAMLKSAQGALDKLKALGDKVTTEDVVEAGGTLVGAGMDPKSVSAMMAQLPQGGEALAGWVNQQDDQMRQREQALEVAHAATRHHMGVNAMRLVAGHHLGGGTGDGGANASGTAGGGGPISGSAPGLMPAMSGPSNGG